MCEAACNIQDQMQRVTPLRGIAGQRVSGGVDRAEFHLPWVGESGGRFRALPSNQINQINPPKSN
jgi:hypothetical protein